MYPSWSPDGAAKIVFERGPAGSSQVWVMEDEDADGVWFQTQLTTTSSYINQMPRWSPDGTQIVFSSYQGNKYHIYVMNLDDGTVQDISNSSFNDFYPEWQPDGTPPSIEASVNPSRPISGWWNLASGAPTVTYTCDDLESGIAWCTSPHTFGEGKDQSHSGTAEDNAGNSAYASVSDIDVDLTAPSLTWNGGPADGASYYFGSVPAAPTCAATDALSGPKDCTVSGYGTTVGSHAMTATTYDLAGNNTVETHTYTVLAWTLNGFYQPVDMGGVWNTVKGGSTVPFKFEVFAGPTELTDVAVIDSFTAKGVTCPGASTPTDDIEFTTTGGTSLRYDPVAGQFIQNWKTPKNPGACYEVTMKTDDGSTLVANFKLK